VIVLSQWCWCPDDNKRCCCILSYHRRASARNGAHAQMLK